ncbi:hypothetical protein Cgig2_001925 [Carnegiea gigantea]|uniref:Replication protein A 70 kDa DNA-binding subunit B/D first OB fold domain-containing protein n=1 Tax=Carnegiea gigantea TaxID=171969 RepID=A0A9Q1QDI5_9CARY|nr:hypothetical protein Cgig2_001925 [Carnegiea gigantea]
MELHSTISASLRCTKALTESSKHPHLEYMLISELTTETTEAPPRAEVRQLVCNNGGGGLLFRIFYGSVTVVVFISPLDNRLSTLYGVMAPCEKYLRDLTKKSRRFTVKVKIIEKTRPQVSSSKIMYQRIHMEDEKGGQMGVTIYGDDIASYVEAIKRRKEHEISDAVVKPLKRQFPLRLEKYEMEFTHRTIIRPVFNETDTDDVPYYCAISQINHAA